MHTYYIYIYVCIHTYEDVAKDDKFLVLELADPVRRCQFSSLLAMNMVWEPWESLVVHSVSHGPAAD